MNNSIKGWATPPCESAHISIYINLQLSKYKLNLGGNPKFTLSQIFSFIGKLSFPACRYLWMVTARSIQFSIYSWMCSFNSLNEPCHFPNSGVLPVSMLPNLGALRMPHRTSIHQTQHFIIWFTWHTQPRSPHLVHQLITKYLHVVPHDPSFSSPGGLTTVSPHMTSPLRRLPLIQQARPHVALHEPSPSFLTQSTWYSTQSSTSSPIQPKLMRLSCATIELHTFLFFTWMICVVSWCLSTSTYPSTYKLVHPSFKHRTNLPIHRTIVDFILF